MIINQNGEIFKPFNSVDEALECSINGGCAEAVIEIATETLDEIEALLILAQRAEDYERTDRACRAISEQLSETLGYDSGLIYDVVRELSGLSAKFRYAQHKARLNTTRRQITLWRKATQAWVDAANEHAENLLNQALTEAGFL